MEPFYLRLHDSNFEWPNKVQSYIYRCHDILHSTYLRTGKCEKIDFQMLKKKWEEKLFDDFKGTLEITYNETIWPPSVPYKSRMMIQIKPQNSSDIFKILIDFTKPIFEAGILITEAGSFPTNLFNIQYIIL